MHSAKQKYKLVIPLDLTWADFDGSQYVVQTFMTEIPVSGVIEKVDVKIDWASAWNQDLGIAIVPTTFMEDAPSLLNYEDVLEAMMTNNYIVNKLGVEPCFPFLIDAGVAQTLEASKGVRLIAKQGELAGIKIHSRHGGVASSGGTIDINVELTIDVTAFDRKSEKFKRQQLYHTSGIIAGMHTSDFSHMIGFPADGVIGNMRLTLHKGDMTQMELLELTDSPQKGAKVTNIVELEPSTKGIILNGLVNSEANYTIITSYNKFRMPVFRDKPVYLHFESNETAIVWTLEYSYIPYPKNQLTELYNLYWQDGEEDYKWIQVPYDLYVKNLEIDWKIHNDVSNEIHVYALKPPINLDFIESGATQGIISLDLGVDEVKYWSLGSWFVSGTVGGGTVNHGNEFLPVNDYWPHGTIVIFDMNESLSATETVDLMCKLNAHSEMHHRYMGSNFLGGANVLEQINGEGGEE